MCSPRPGERAVHHSRGVHPAVRSWRPHSLFLLSLCLPLVETRSGPPHSPVYQCCHGVHIRFALPDLSLPPWFLYDPVSREWSGFWIVAIDSLASEMGFSFTIVPDAFSAFDYSKPLRLMLRDEADVGITDVSDPITLSNLDGAECTPGLVDSTYGALVLQTPKPPSIFDIFRPIAPGVWLMTVLTLLLASVVLTSLNVLVPPDSASPQVRSLSVQEVCKAFYHVLAALLNGEDYEWVTWPGRVLRLGMLFFALVLISTYTANLAAFFTRPEYIIHGPRDLAELQSATVCVLTNQYDDKLRPYVSRIVHGIASSAVSSPGSYAAAKDACHKKLRNEEVDAWIDDMNSLTSYLLSHCGDLHLVPSISFLKQQPAMCLSKANSTLAWQLSSALAFLKLQPSYQSIMREYFGVGTSCGDEGEDEQDTTPVPLSGMWGLFTITFAFILLSCAVATCFTVWERIQAKKQCKDCPTPTSTEGEMLRLLLHKVDELLSRTSEC